MFVRRAVFMLGQRWREATHIRRFEQATGSPLVAQADKLLQIVKANQCSAFGRKHHFERICSISDYQSLVPPSGYEDLKPYIEATIAGARQQLTRQEPFMFATTSGTTASPKFIPITSEHLRDYTHAFEIHSYHMIRDYPQAAMGRFFIIASNDEEGRVASGLPYGSVSGLLNRRQSPFLRKSFALPYEMCKIKDVEAKYYLMLRCTLAQDVTAVIACNPSSLVLLADQLRDHAGDLLRDLYNGSVKACFRPPRALYPAFADVLAADRQKARALAQIAEAAGTLLPSMIWPNLELISCWKGGPMSFYLEQLPQRYAHVPVRDLGYMATEGRGSIPLANAGAGGVLALTSHFFEFVREDEADGSSPSFVTLDRLELHGRYYIYFTTSAGLYRYNINDLVEVVGFYRRTPVIQFIRKGAGVSSITGEKLTEEQVQVALCFAVRQLGLKNMEHFTAVVRLSNPPYYACFAESGSPLAETVRREFARIFDQSLRAQNIEYCDKRDSRRLGAPVLITVPRGTYTRLRQKRVQEGAPEAQVKIPLLSCRSELGDCLAAMAAVDPAA